MKAIKAAIPATDPSASAIHVGADVPTSAPATAPATVASAGATALPTTASTTLPSLGEPILVTADGTRYYDGQKTLCAIDPGGRQTMWPLPAIATGQAPAHLVQTADGRLYLFNQGGRMLRIRSTPSQPEPFEIEATFTRDIPDTADLIRMWLDPAGRIDVEWGHQLAILFPAGYIPRPIAEKMLNDTGGN
jgi:hypothetical protein